MTTYVANTTTLTLSKLKDKVTGATITDAVVSVTVKNKRHNALNVGGVSWPMTMTPNGDGSYTATLPDDAELTRGAEYKAAISVTVDGIGKAQFNFYFTAIERPLS